MERVRFPRPRLAIRLLPLLDVIFILLTFFIILPHGVYRKRAGERPEVREFRSDSIRLKKVSSDVPVFIRVLPDDWVYVKAKVSSYRWAPGEGKPFKFQVRTKGDWERLVGVLEGLFRRSNRYRLSLMSSRGGEELERGLRPLRVFIQLEVHRYAYLRLVWHLRRFLQRWCRLNRGYRLVVRFIS